MVSRSVNAARHVAPGLWARLDALPPELRPTLMRGDVAFGCEVYLCACEARVRLTGWSRDRRVVVTRRPAPHAGREHPPSRQQEQALMDSVVRMGWECTVLVTG
jgi:hypothetical protein